MEVPFHPMAVHFPVALSFLLPPLILIFAYMIKINKMTPHGWLIIIGLQMALTATGYIASETGENEEKKVQEVVGRKLVHEHEEVAEIFVGSTVIALAVSVAAFFIRKEFQFTVKLGVFIVSLVSSYLSYQTGKLGGELVYRHGAANAYLKNTDLAPPQGILPTPGINTSESPFPVDESESLKRDETDYSEQNDMTEFEDEMGRQED